MSEDWVAQRRPKRRADPTTMSLRVYVTCRQCGGTEGSWKGTEHWQCGECGKRVRAKRSVVVPATPVIDPAEVAMLKALANRALLALDYREHQVVTRFYGFWTGAPMTFVEIADDLNMSLNVAYKIHRIAMGKMRRTLGVKLHGQR